MHPGADAAPDVSIGMPLFFGRPSTEGLERDGLYRRRGGSPSNTGSGSNPAAFGDVRCATASLLAQNGLVAQ